MTMKQQKEDAPNITTFILPSVELGPGVSLFGVPGDSLFDVAGVSLFDVISCSLVFILLVAFDWRNVSIVDLRFWGELFSSPTSEDSLTPVRGYTTQSYQEISLHKNLLIISNFFPKRNTNCCQFLCKLQMYLAKSSSLINS